MLLLLSFFQFIFWSKIIVALFLPQNNFCPFYLWAPSLFRNSTDLQMFKEAKERQIDFYFLKAKSSWGSQNPTAHLLRTPFERRRPQPLPWMVKQIGEDSTREKRRCAILAVVKSYYMKCTHIWLLLKSWYEYKNNQITLPFLLFISTRIWQ